MSLSVWFSDISQVLTAFLIQSRCSINIYRMGERKRRRIEADGSSYNFQRLTDSMLSIKTMRLRMRLKDNRIC